MVLYEAIFCFLLTASIQVAKTERTIICHYNSKAFYREGQAQFNISDMPPALQYCTHVVYGFAGINPNNFKLEPLNKHFDVEMQNYNKIVNMKRDIGGLEVLLSVGGNEDVTGDDSKQKYLSLLESSEHRQNFIDSAIELLKRFNFDGLDLAWQFPETKPKKNRGVLSSAFHSLKKKIVGKSTSDENAEAHREQFTSFVREIKNKFKPNNFLLTLRVLPNVNSTVYFNPRALAPHLDFVSLMLFDFHTPERNPDEADYPSPLFEVIDRRLEENIDSQVRFWLDSGTPKPKIIIGVSTFGRAWKLESSVTSELPPVSADGAANGGPFIKEKGLWSYPEICNAIGNPEKKKRIQKFVDPTMRYGAYAFRLPKKNEYDGIWVGFDDPETVAKKGVYLRSKGLGGFAIDDITLDDFKGFCASDKFPILKAAKVALQ